MKNLLIAVLFLTAALPQFVIAQTGTNLNLDLIQKNLDALGESSIIVEFRSPNISNDFLCRTRSGRASQRFLLGGFPDRAL